MSRPAGMLVQRSVPFIPVGCRTRQVYRLSIVCHVLTSTKHRAVSKLLVRTLIYMSV
jgi:hypothetical protein